MSVCLSVCLSIHPSHLRSNQSLPQSGYVCHCYINMLGKVDVGQVIHEVISYLLC